VSDQRTPVPTREGIDRIRRLNDVTNNAPPEDRLPGTYRRPLAARAASNGRGRPAANGARGRSAGAAARPVGRRLALLNCAPRDGAAAAGRTDDLDPAALGLR
jgi:hypothetical protein